MDDRQLRLRAPRASGGMREPGTLFCGMTVDPGPDRFRFHIAYTDKAEEEE